MDRYALHLAGGPGGPGPLLSGSSFPAPGAGGTLHLFGGSPKYVVRNYLDFSGPRATFLGTPTPGAGYMTLSGGAYLQTLIPETLTGYHMLFARRPVSGSAVGFYGNFAGGAPSGVGFFATAASTAMTSSVWADGGGAVSRSLPASSVAGWGLYGLELRASGGSVIRNLATGEEMTQANTGNRGVRPDGAKMRVGSFAGSTYVGACDVAAVGAFSAAPGAVWEAEALAWAREYAADFSLDF